MDAPWFRRNRLFVTGIVVALGWLMAAVALMQSIDPDDSRLESGNYQTYHRYLNIVSYVALSSFILAIVVLFAWILKILQERRRLEDAPGGRRTLKVVLVVSLFLLASGLMCARLAVAFVDRSPQIMQTERLNSHFYYLTHRPTSDWDSNEIILYECSRPYMDCHLIHSEYESSDIDQYDLMAVPETATIQLMKDGRAVYTYSSAPSN